MNLASSRLRDDRWLLAALALLVAVRTAAILVLAGPPVSDGLAYHTMASTFAQGAPMVDNFGNRLFYSAGYALLLALAYAVGGASSLSGHALNLMLAVVSGALIYRIMRQFDASRAISAVAVGAFALWLPGIWNGAMLARENLTVPLVLAVMSGTIEMIQQHRGAVATGAAWVGGVIGATASAGVLLGPLSAIVGGKSPRLLLGLVAGIAIAALPWAAATHATFGSVRLTSNSGFNLYLGNNPSATGSFVSIADTPAGPDWHLLLRTRGEFGASEELGRRARAWIATHPQAALELAARKLALFWAPNIPDAKDWQSSRMISLVRLFEVAQYLALVLFGFVGLIALARSNALLAIAVLAIIFGFWVPHMFAYIITRYRDPVMPILLVLGVRWVSARLEWRRQGHRERRRVG